MPKAGLEAYKSRRRSSGGGGGEEPRSLGTGRIIDALAAENRFERNADSAERLLEQGAEDDGFLQQVATWGIDMFDKTGLDSALERADRIRRTLALAAQDYSGVDARHGYQFQPADYGDILTGNPEGLEKRITEATGDPDAADRVYGHHRDISGSVLLQNIAGWNADYAKNFDTPLPDGIDKFASDALRFIPSLALDMGLDPFSYVTGGLGGLGRNAATKAVTGTVRSVAATTTKELIEAGGAKAARDLVESAGYSGLRRSTASGIIDDAAKLGGNWEDAVRKASGYTTDIPVGLADDATEAVGSYALKNVDNAVPTADSPWNRKLQDIVKVIEQKDFGSQNPAWREWIEHAEKFDRSMAWTTGGIKFGPGGVKSLIRPIPGVTEATRGITRRAMSKVTQAPGLRIGSEAFKGSTPESLWLKLRGGFSSEGAERILAIQGRSPSSYIDYMNATDVFPNAIVADLFGQIDPEMNVRGLYNKFEKNLRSNADVTKAQADDIMKHVDQTLGSGRVVDMNIDDPILRQQIEELAQTYQSEWDKTRVALAQVFPELSEEAVGDRTYRPLIFSEDFELTMRRMVNLHRESFDAVDSPTSLKAWADRLGLEDRTIDGQTVTATDQLNLFRQTIDTFENRNAVARPFGETGELNMRDLGRGVMSLQTDGTVFADLGTMSEVLQDVATRIADDLGLRGGAINRLREGSALVLDPREQMARYTDSAMATVKERVFAGEVLRQRYASSLNKEFKFPQFLSSVGEDGTLEDAYKFLEAHEAFTDAEVAKQALLSVGDRSLNLPGALNRITIHKAIMDNPVFARVVEDLERNWEAALNTRNEFPFLYRDEVTKMMASNPELDQVQAQALVSSQLLTGLEDTTAQYMSDVHLIIFENTRPASALVDQVPGNSAAKHDAVNAYAEAQEQSMERAMSEYRNEYMKVFGADIPPESLDVEGMLRTPRFVEMLEEAGEKATARAAAAADETARRFRQKASDLAVEGAFELDVEVAKLSASIAERKAQAIHALQQGVDIPAMQTQRVSIPMLHGVGTKVGKSLQDAGLNPAIAPYDVKGRAAAAAKHDANLFFLDPEWIQKIETRGFKEVPVDLEGANTFRVLNHALTGHDDFVRMDIPKNPQQWWDDNLMQVTNGVWMSRHDMSKPVLVVNQMPNGPADQNALLNTIQDHMGSAKSLYVDLPDVTSAFKPTMHYDVRNYDQTLFEVATSWQAQTRYPDLSYKEIEDLIFQANPGSPNDTRKIFKNAEGKWEYQGWVEAPNPPKGAIGKRPRARTEKVLGASESKFDVVGQSAKARTDKRERTWAMRQAAERGLEWEWLDDPYNDRIGKWRYNGESPEMERLFPILKVGDEDIVAFGEDFPESWNEIMATEFDSVARNGTSPQDRIVNIREELAERLRIVGIDDEEVVEDITREYMERLSNTIAAAEDIEPRTAVGGSGTRMGNAELIDDLGEAGDVPTQFEGGLGEGRYDNPRFLSSKGAEDANRTRANMERVLIDYKEEAISTLTIDIKDSHSFPWSNKTVEQMQGDDYFRDPATAIIYPVGTKLKFPSHETVATWLRDTPDEVWSPGSAYPVQELLKVDNRARGPVTSRASLRKQYEALASGELEHMTVGRQVGEQESLFPAIREQERAEGITRTIQEQVPADLEGEIRPTTGVPIEVRPTPEDNYWLFDHFTEPTRAAAAERPWYNPQTRLRVERNLKQNDRFTFDPDEMVNIDHRGINGGFVGGTGFGNPYTSNQKWADEVEGMILVPSEAEGVRRYATDLWTRIANDRAFRKRVGDLSGQELWMWRTDGRGPTNHGEVLADAADQIAAMRAQTGEDAATGVALMREVTDLAGAMAGRDELAREQAAIRSAIRQAQESGEDTTELVANLEIVSEQLRNADAAVTLPATRRPVIPPPPENATRDDIIEWKIRLEQEQMSLYRESDELPGIAYHQVDPTLAPGFNETFEDVSKTLPLQEGDIPFRQVPDDRSIIDVTDNMARETNYQMEVANPARLHDLGSDLPQEGVVAGMNDTPLRYMQEQQMGDFVGGTLKRIFGRSGKSAEQHLMDGYLNQLVETYEKIFNDMRKAWGPDLQKMANINGIDMGGASRAMSSVTAGRQMNALNDPDLLKLMVIFDEWKKAANAAGDIPFEVHGTPYHPLELADLVDQIQAKRGLSTSDDLIGIRQAVGDLDRIDFESDTRTLVDTLSESLTVGREGTVDDRKMAIRAWKSQFGEDKDRLQAAVQSTFGPEWKIHAAEVDGVPVVTIDKPGSDAAAIEKWGGYETALDALEIGELSKAQATAAGAPQLAMAGDTVMHIDQILQTTPHVKGADAARGRREAMSTYFKNISAESQKAMGNGNANKLRSLTITRNRDGSYKMTPMFRELMELLESSPRHQDFVRWQVESGFVAALDDWSDEAFQSWWHTQRHQAALFQHSEEQTQSMLNELTRIIMDQEWQTWKTQDLESMMFMNKTLATHLGGLQELGVGQPSTVRPIREGQPFLEGLGTDMEFREYARIAQEADNMKLAQRQETVRDTVAALIEVFNAYEHSPQFATLRNEFDLLPATKAEKIKESLENALQEERFWMRSPDKPGMVTAKSLGIESGMFSNMQIDAQFAPFVEKTMNNSKAVFTPYAQSELGRLGRHLIQLWKGAATVARPSFHVRNMIGGITNGFIADVGPQHYFSTFDDVRAFRRGLKAVELGKIGDIDGDIFESFVLSQVSEANQAMFREAWQQGVIGSSFTRAEQLYSATSKMSIKPWETSFAPFQIGGLWMENIEDHLRISAFHRWFDNKAVAKNPALAASEGAKAKAIVNAIHFDYSDLTRQEQWIKNFVPFYVWSRRNIPLQMRTLFQDPTYMLWYYRARSNWNEQQLATMEDIDPMTRYVSKTAFLLPFSRTNDEGWSRMMWEPQLPMHDLDSFPWQDGPMGFLTPSWIFPMATDLLGPHITAPLKAAAQAEEGGETTAPAGLNAVLAALDQIPVVQGIIPESYPDPEKWAPDMDYRIGKWTNVFTNAAVPFYHDYRAFLGIMPNNPYRAAQEGWMPGENEGDVSNKDRILLGPLGRTFGRGAGVSWFTPNDAYFEARNVEDRLKTIGLNESYKRGFQPEAEEATSIPPELVEQIIASMTSG